MKDDAIINGILSFFIPGLGQAIEGYKTRGVILFVIAIIIAGALYVFHPGNIINYVVSATYGLLAGYDAYRLY